MGFGIVGGLNVVNDASAGSAAVMFMCAAQASAGQFTVPQTVLQQVPPISTGDSGLAIMTVTAGGLAPFGSMTGLDGGAVVYFNGTGLEATYQ